MSRGYGFFGGNYEDFGPKRESKYQIKALAEANIQVEMLAENVKSLFDRTGHKKKTSSNEIFPPQTIN